MIYCTARTTNQPVAVGCKTPALKGFLARVTGPRLAGRGRS
jgi:hypothetical protein